jgi:hypothetical protein
MVGLTGRTPAGRNVRWPGYAEIGGQILEDGGSLQDCEQDIANSRVDVLFQNDYGFAWKDFDAGREDGATQPDPARMLQRRR